MAVDLRETIANVSWTVFISLKRNAQLASERGNGHKSIARRFFDIVVGNKSVELYH